MQTMTQSSCKTQTREVPDTIAKSASEQFAQLLTHAFLEASTEVQGVIKDMSKIVSDPEVDDDDRAAALDTLIEALFPRHHNGDLGIDINDLRDIAPAEVKNEEFPAADAEEATFAERLAAIMKDRDMSQSTLATKIGVKQPAISMMLARQCRPQRHTVRKLADALGVAPEDLWPAFVKKD